MTLLLKNVLFTIVFPGTTAVFLPYLVMSRQSREGPRTWSAWTMMAALFAMTGVVIYVRCVWDFARRGRATPAPIDPPRVLVVEGLYRNVRNPMYLGVLLFLVGQCLFFRSWNLVIYTGIWFLSAHLFTVFYEEPTLRRKFPDAYAAYSEAVRRWIPGPPCTSREGSPRQR